ARTVTRRARCGKPVAVVVFDLAGFKAINDSFGHDTGDAALVAVAKRLSAAPVVAGCVRLGGDEFAAVLAPRRNMDWKIVLDVFSRRLCLPMFTNDGAVDIRVRLGAAVATRADRDLPRLLTAADAVMYAARRDEQTLGVVHGSAAYLSRPRSRARDDQDAELVQTVTV
ncbi:MAG: GGDEF domain-containing protein, partial [Stackebrandtia sp.]